MTRPLGSTTGTGRTGTGAVGAGRKRKSPGAVRRERALAERANIEQAIEQTGVERPSTMTEDAILRVLRVPPEYAGMRVDVFVQAQLRNTSRTRARAIVERGAFTPDGRSLRPSGRVKAEERVLLWRRPLDEESAPLELRTIFEDEHLLVLDKPPLVAVHPTARYYHQTITRQLQVSRPGEFFALIHRLDRETSGVLLLGRTPEADRAFKRMFEDRSLAIQNRTTPKGKKRKIRPGNPIEKTYLAITWGVPEDGLISKPVEEDSDNPLRVKMRIARSDRGLAAATEIAVLEKKGDYALVRCALHTGRQHQIRIHLASVGCPVVGDKLYGPDELLLARAADRSLTAADLAVLELPRHALHAHRYALTHPMTGEKLELVSPLAPDLQEFWDGI